MDDPDWTSADYDPRAYRDGLLVPPHEAPTPALEERSATQAPHRLTEAERARFERLVQEEASVSTERRVLHERIDFVRAEAPRNRTLADQLVHLTSRERELSHRRARIQAEIDEILGREGRGAGDLPPGD